MQVFPVEAYHTETAQIVSDVFLTMLGETAEPCAPGLLDPESTLTGAIYFAGSWMGAVLVEASELQARIWTSRLMSIPLPESLTDDVRDAMGEIVNMVGGNLKSVLPSGVGLSMPTVVQGRNYSLKICGGNLVHRQYFQAPDGQFCVTLVEVVK